MWWLGAHAASMEAFYVLATDCGTIFDPNCTYELVTKLQADLALQAVTGTRRIMSSAMQGDSFAEMCTSPIDFMLRMLQTFEFEIDHVTFKSLDDALGAMQVIPGPCGLYRFSSLGNLRSGLMHQYFSMLSRKTRGLIVGNVELVEDRIPGALLSFPLKGSKEPTCKPRTGWARTGFAQDAIFYVEAEIPLEMLCKQRRRWLNGTFMTYFWILQEGIITNANQAFFRRYATWCLTILYVIQAATIRIVGPALLIAVAIRFGLMAPDLVDDPALFFDPEHEFDALDTTRDRAAIIIGGTYYILFCLFVIFHTPRAVAIKDNSILRYTEAKKFRSDKSSVYHAALMHLSIIVNAIVFLIFCFNTVGILYISGWEGSPTPVKIMVILAVGPFAFAFFESVSRCNLKGFISLLVSAPFALPLMPWFTVWLPIYATTRLPDLTWGNRDSAGSDHSEKAERRAKIGRMVATLLVIGNTLVATIITLNFQMFVIVMIGYTFVLSSTFLLSILAFLTKPFRGCASDVQEEACGSLQDEDEPISTYLDLMDPTKQVAVASVPTYAPPRKSSHKKEDSSGDSTESDDGASATAEDSEKAGELAPIT